MKFTYSAAAAILAAVAQAQSIADLTSQIPSCSLSCLQTAITGAGCSITDNACQCGDKKSTITTNATPCVLKACSTSDALKVQQITGQICQLVSSGSGGSSSAGSSSMASSMASSAMSQTSMASSVGASATSSVASGASSASSRASSATSGAAAGASSMASSAASKASSAASSATGSAPAQVTSSGANKAQVLGAVGGAALLAAFAL